MAGDSEERRSLVKEGTCSSKKTGAVQWTIDHSLALCAIVASLAMGIPTIIQQSNSQNDINTLQADVNKLGTQIGQLQLDLLEAQFQLDQLEEDIQNIEDDVDPLEARLDDLTLSVNQTLANATLLAAEIEDIRDQAAADSATVQDQLSSLNVTEIEVQIGNVNATAIDLTLTASELDTAFEELATQFSKSDAGNITLRLDNATDRIRSLEERGVHYESFTDANLTGGWFYDGTWYRGTADAHFCAAPPIQGDVDLTVDMSLHLGSIVGDVFQLLLSITDSNANNNDFKGNFNWGLICAGQHEKPPEWTACRRYFGYEYLSKRTQFLPVKWDPKASRLLRIQASETFIQGFNDADLNCNSANLNGFSVQLEGVLHAGLV